jgi:hypothetical protein
MAQREQKVVHKVAAPPKRKRIAAAENDVRRGLKDTDRRGIPNDVPGARKARRA